MRAISTKTGTILANNAQLYQRLAISSKSLGASQEQLLQLTETVGNLGRVSGSSAEDIKNSTRQLAQGLGSTFFRAEEFNSIMEQMPALLQYAADEMDGINGDVGKLRELMKDGKLSSKEFFAAILNSSEKARKAAEKLPLTFTESMNIVKNSLLDVSRSLNNTSGLTTRLGAGVRALSSIITQSFSGIGTATGNTKEIIKETEGQVVKLVAVFGTLRDISDRVGAALFKLGDDLIEGVMTPIKMVIDGYDLLFTKLSSIKGLEFLDPNAAKNAAKEYEKLNDKYISIANNISEAENNIKSFYSAGGQMESPIAENLRREILTYGKQLEDAKEKRDSFFAEKGSLIGKGQQQLLTEGRTLGQDFGRNFKEGVLGGESISEIYARNLIETADTLAAAQNKVIEDLPGLDRMVASASEGGKTIGQSLLESFSSELDAFGGNTSGLLVDKLFGDTDKSFREVARTLVKNLLSDILQALVFSPLINSIKATLGSILDPTGGAGGILGAPASGGLSSIFSAFSGMFGGARAAGGPVNMNTPYLVGEKGPELFIPKNSGDILSNRQTMSSMSSGSSNQTVNIVVNTPDAQSFMLAKNQIEAQARRMLRNS